MDLQQQKEWVTGRENSQVDMVFSHGLDMGRALGHKLHGIFFNFWWKVKRLLQVSSDENSVVVWCFLDEWIRPPGNDYLLYPFLSRHFFESMMFRTFRLVDEWTNRFPRFFQPTGELDRNGLPVLRQPEAFCKKSGAL